eukprot:CAMPEP_0202727290 /NCGR_PEP_ID=MMETSP1385-20130828/185050_1 /ASSEMBLY_ACC=CAM_ASM_000861 /TAXON_ID=933848 /ORGANISM="Elphidium margaritaceum" /LENGTH=825 /DNA_ID=CAMNT_0049393529 /DNA_START=27 /DNA_END=2501 /DNA_ORIENTATION=-
MAQPASSNTTELSFKFITYLPQDAGYNVDTHLTSDYMKSTLTTLSENDEMRRVQLLQIINDDLSNLLRLPFKAFIESMKRADIQKYLRSFLQHCRRCTDNLGALHLQNEDEADEEKQNGTANQSGEGRLDMYGIDELSQNIRHKTFLVVCRLTDNDEINSNTNNVFPDTAHYAQWLYDEWIFDIPFIFDFCAIYNFSNAQQTKQCVSYIFEVQPKYNQDLKHAIQLMRQRLDEVCQAYHSTDPDLKLSRNDKQQQQHRPKNTWQNLNHDMFTIQEMLLNLYALVQSYTPASTLYCELEVLTQLVVLVDVTFPIIQEQTKQFLQPRKLVHSRDKLAYEQHPSIVVCTRLCLLLVHAVLTLQYQPLYEDMNGGGNNEMESLKSTARKLCQFLNDTTNVSGFQSLHIGARPLIEVGSFARKLFGTFTDLHALMNHLLSHAIIGLSDVAMISHLIRDISKQVMDAHKQQYQEDEKNNDDDGGGDDDDGLQQNIAKLLQIFPDHSAEYCRQLLLYFNGQFDPAVNAVLEGTAPISIEAVDDDDDDENENGAKKKTNKKIQKRKDSSQQQQQKQKFIGRALKRDEDEEFFDMFAFDDNSVKKYVKKGRYDMYDDDVDDTYLQYDGCGVDDVGYLSLSEDDNENDAKQIQLPVATEVKDDQTAEVVDTLEAQLDRHSYQFIPRESEVDNQAQDVRFKGYKQQHGARDRDRHSVRGQKPRSGNVHSGEDYSRKNTHAQHRAQQRQPQPQHERPQHVAQARYRERDQEQPPQQHRQPRPQHMAQPPQQQQNENENEQEYYEEDGGGRGGGRGGYQVRLRGGARGMGRGRGRGGG